MRSLVGIDAGVLDETEAGAADVGVLVLSDTAGDVGTVEADVEVSGAGGLDGGDAFGERGGELGASSVAMARGALRRRLASSKATGRASSPRAMEGGCSTARLGSVMEYFCARMAWMRATSDCWIVRYMLRIHRLIGLVSVYVSWPDAADADEFCASQEQITLQLWEL